MRVKITQVGDPIVKPWSAVPLAMFFLSMLLPTPTDNVHPKPQAQYSCKSRDVKGGLTRSNVFCSEMEKRADSADISVLFFSLVVLIFWLYTRKLAKTAVLLALC